MALGFDTNVQPFDVSLAALFRRYLINEYRPTNRTWSNSEKQNIWPYTPGL